MSGPVVRNRRRISERWGYFPPRLPDKEGKNGQRDENGAIDIAGHHQPEHRRQQTRDYRRNGKGKVALHEIRREQARALIFAGERQ